MPLYSSPGMYLLGRTAQGYLACSSTKDPTGSGGWRNTTWAKYWNVTLAGEHFATGVPDLQPMAGGLKNPTGPITVRRMANGQHLLLYYNNFARGSGYNRNPYWLAAGIETAGELLFSQPEVALYYAAYPNGTGHEGADARPGYPDFIQQPDSPEDIWITETDKVAARIHKIDGQLLQALFQQATISAVAEGAAVTLTAADQGHTVSLGTHSFPSLQEYKEPRQGFTIDLMVSGFWRAATGQVLLDSRDLAGRGVALIVTSGEQPDDSLGITLVFSDGRTTSVNAMDPLCAAALLSDTDHYMATVVDAGPHIVSFMVWYSVRWRWQAGVWLVLVP